MKQQDSPDFAELWICIQVEIRLMHSFLLQGRWKEAADCASNCERISVKLINWCDEMDEIEKSEAK